MASCEIRIQYNIPRNTANIRQGTRMYLFGTVKEDNRQTNDVNWSIQSITLNGSAVTANVTLSEFGIIDVGSNVTPNTIITVRATCVYNQSIYKDLVLTVTE